MLQRKGGVYIIHKTNCRLIVDNAFFHHYYISLENEENPEKYDKMLTILVDKNTFLSRQRVLYWSTVVVLYNI